MLLFIITLVIAIIAGILAYVLYWKSDLAELFSSISIIVCGVLTVILLIMGIIHVANVIEAPAFVAGCEQRYDALVYQLENDIYDNNNDLGKKELYDQIREWNEDLAVGKTYQDDIWVGMFYPDVYDQFEFIEFNKEG